MKLADLSKTEVAWLRSLEETGPINMTVPLSSSLQDLVDKGLIEAPFAVGRTTVVTVQLIMVPKWRMLS